MNRNKRKGTMNSKRKRRKLRMKKGPPSEDHSQPMETVMQATEQQQKMFMLVHSKSMKIVMQATSMLLEILLRLPVKSLLRFMCVCKHWKTLISSHLFRKLHREKHTSSPPLLVASYNSSRFDIKQSDRYTYLITFDFFNGNLVEKVTVPIALKTFYMATPPYQSKLLFFFNFPLMEFYLYNPSTRQSFLLTNPSCFSPPEVKKDYSSDYGYPRLRRSSRLANASPLKNYYSGGYGYIPSKDEYIMVHLVKLSYGKLCCEVLNIISISNDNFKLYYNLWRSSSEATIIIRKVLGAAVFVGGVFYWQALTNINPRDGFILSFDVETDSLSTFAYPEDRFTHKANLLELNNDLFLYYCPESPSVLVMWKLYSDTKLWTRYWKFDLGNSFGFKGGSLHDRYRNMIEFVYNIKFLKGYEDLPCDKLVSAKMGEMNLDLEEVEDEEDMEDEEDEEYDYIPLWSSGAAHTNMFTL